MIRRNSQRPAARIVLCTLLAIVAAHGTSNVFARTIGPDAYGYTMTDEVPFEFIDISAVGQRILQAQSNSTASDGLPFDFNYYGTNYRQGLINLNGTFYLGTQGLPDWVNITLVHPQALRNRPSIVPFWDDMINQPLTQQAVYVATTGFAGSRRHIVQWNSAHNDGPPTDSAQYQMVLYEGSNDIQFNYRDVEFGQANIDFGASATVGLRNTDGQLNGQYLRWSHGEPALHDGLSLRIRADERGPRETLVAAGSRWRYLDDGSNQGIQWRQPGFSDFLWKQGFAQLGYGDGDEQTVVRSSDPRPVTTYFRHSFTVADPTSIETLTLLMLRDDGAAVYVNGFEVARDLLDSNAPFNQYATGDPVSSDEENAFIVYNVNPQFLRPGTNVLAVEVHQQSPDSSDLSFDLQLLATRMLVPEPGTGAMAAVGLGAALLFGHRSRRRATRSSDDDQRATKRS
jgi:hypothetical protein